MQDLAKQVLAISRKGLNARAKLSVAGDNESGFLQELDRMADRGVTPAEDLLGRYHGRWNQDVRHVFEDEAY